MGGWAEGTSVQMGGLLFHKLEDKLAAAALVKRDHRLILQLESVQSKVPFCKDVLKDLDDIYCPVTRISSGTPPTPMGTDLVRYVSLIPLNIEG